MTSLAVLAEYAYMVLPETRSPPRMSPSASMSRSSSPRGVSSMQVGKTEDKKTRKCGEHIAFFTGLLAAEREKEKNGHERQDGERADIERAGYRIRDDACND